MQEKEFDNENWCVKLENEDQVDRLERFIKPIRPDDWAYSNTFDLVMPYYGVVENELYISSLPFGDEYELGQLAVSIIAYKLQSFLNKKKTKITVHKWEPEHGDVVLASITGDKYKKVSYMYTDTNQSGQQRYYGVPLEDIRATVLESGQKIIKLTAFKRIKPLYE